MSSALPLPHGNMPTVGYGLWKVGKDKASSLVKSVIGSGYRHVDSAANYGNEKEVNKEKVNKYLDFFSKVGEGIEEPIKDGICSREDLFITSKLWNTYHDPEHVEDA